MDREDQGAPERDPDDDWAADAEGDRFRGWISPDDRLWRHPSESGGVPAVPPPAGGGSRGRATSWIIGGATACFLIALVAAGLTISSTGGTDDSAAGSRGPLRLDSPPTTEVATASFFSASRAEQMAADVAPSTVGLRVVRAGGTTMATGLVAMSGGIIVTASSAVSGARSITVTEPGGKRLPGTLVATDSVTGLAVVHIADDLPTASYDDSAPAVGDWPVAMSLEPAGRSGGKPATSVSTGPVSSVAPAGRDGLSAIDVVLPLTSGDVGCPLVDTRGSVAGLLESVGVAHGLTVSVFLPAQLVSHVVQQLVDSGQVDQGWLGVDVRSTVGTPASAAGAVVVAVAADSPAALGGLADGDVITGVDGLPVRSSADLVTDLYALGPETPVNIDYRSPTSGSTYASVVLASDGGDAPVLTASP